MKNNPKKIKSNLLEFAIAQKFARQQVPLVIVAKNLNKEEKHE
jgi:hypothetical protein